MSERGSFITEYISCNQCLDGAKQVLMEDQKHLRGVQIPKWTACTGEDDLPIVAGKIGGTYAGEELIDFELELSPKLSKLICHPLRVAIIAEVGQQIYEVLPDGWGGVEDAR